MLILQIYNVSKCISENPNCISEFSIEYIRKSQMYFRNLDSISKKKKNVICTRISENVVIYISLFSEIKVRYSNIQLRILK